jgi:putative transposase
MIRAHKITLKLNNKQKTYMAKASGCARFAYNWALAEWQKEYAAGKKPNEAAMRRSLNAVKTTEFPWMLEVTKCAPQMAIKDLGKAFQNFFAKRTGYPKFKKKGLHDSFTLSNDQTKICGKRLRIPNLGFVKMREELRFDGKLLWVTVSRSGNDWCASVSVEIPDATTIQVNNAKVQSNSVVGIDLGISQLATLSTGEVFANPNALEKKLKTLRRVSRGLSRKQKGSRNREKSRRKLCDLHRSISDLRSDTLHKMTTSISKRFGVVCLEDLNVRGMTKNKHLARRLSDSSFGEIRRQLEYKTTSRGGRVLFVNAFFPSSKLCHVCLAKNESLTLADRTWQCSGCGTVHDRDLNAALNIRNHAVSYTVAGDARKACGEDGSGSKAVKRPRVKPASMKQESSVELTQVGLGRS